MTELRCRKPSFAAGFLLLVVIVTSGCNPPKGHLIVFNEYVLSGNYASAGAFAEGKIRKNSDPSGEDLLWAMQLASIERGQKDYRKSTEWFDRSEEMLKFYDNQLKIADGIGATIVNDNVIPYRGEEYDGVMVNTYKALNFVIQGNTELARVEFNRALDRQRRAKEKFSEEIRKLETELAERNEKNNQYDIKATVDDPNTMALIEAKYPMVSNFEPYPDFINPFATYMAALFFSLDGDQEKAVYLFKESYGMVNDNPWIGEDLLKTDDILDGKGRLEHTVWVIFENGLGPVKEEFRVDLPLFLVTQKVRYIGIALPKLRLRSAAYPYLTVKTADTVCQTHLVASMDRIIQTEFRKDFKSILTRAIVSATAKAVAQYALQDNDNTYAALFVALYAAGTTSADVRIWTTLPKNFQVARLAKPEDGRLTIVPPGSTPFDISIGDCNNAVVYVRIVSEHALPIYEVIRF